MSKDYFLGIKRRIKQFTVFEHPRSLPPGGYAIATEFLRLGRLRSDFFLSPIQHPIGGTPTTKSMLSFN
ncbi:hypothetical protein [Nostoc sp. DSM 114160]